MNWDELVEREQMSRTYDFHYHIDLQFFAGLNSPANQGVHYRYTIITVDTFNGWPKDNKRPYNYSLEIWTPDS